MADHDLTQAVPIGLYLQQFERNGFDPFHEVKQEVPALKLQLAILFRSLFG